MYVMGFREKCGILECGDAIIEGSLLHRIQKCSSCSLDGRLDHSLLTACLTHFVTLYNDKNEKEYIFSEL